MEKEMLQDRAWLEINLNNLENNINEIRKTIPSKTKIMAVVKANAYGHGIIDISKKLEQIGIQDFAVATLQEAITLRQNRIKGNILILGFTSIENLHYVIDYDLIQTIVDEEYAEKILNLSYNKKIKVHIKVNTGMNRIGINYKNINFIKELYLSNKIDVLGIFSHLSVSDSNDQEDIDFTKMQISRFNDLIKKLKTDMIDVGKTHLQSSYGILNYPELEYDYVRPGIIMYGIHSEKNMTTKVKLNIKPVLSLKAKITDVKEINENDSVSYGRKYIALQREKIASVSIGYADGYPRNLSCKNVSVLINNHYAQIIGRICMDQLIIKINNLDVKQGDIVTLIGESEKISAETIANCSDTITNELLSRLGERLSRIINE
ncbi:MAG: serine racemase VanT catalytic subunit [Bacilli bacterium]|nr:serine racemase VanT catalytic subunit [Bacilli bacterium]MDY5058872.1 serine racemase VanT catalytic subunit [Bacilli bacterium]